MRKTKTYAELQGARGFSSRAFALLFLSFSFFFFAFGNGGRSALKILEYGRNILF
jgi:hypothetical protein